MKIETGVILEIPLPKNFGYAYGKYVDVVQFTGRSFDSNLIKIYDFVTETPLKNIDILKNTEYLMGPVILYKRPSNRKPLRWRPIGKYLTDEDFEVPYFKNSPKSIMLVDDESKLTPWFGSQLGLNIVELPYNNIKHLEQTVLQGPEQLETRIIMECIRKKGNDVLDFYDLEKEPDYIKSVYTRMINVPVYSTIPKEIRGKPLFIKI